MDQNKRIDELEAQVRRLTEVVEQLLSEAPDSGGPEEGKLPFPVRVRSVRDVRERVDRALRVEEDETIESRIGAVWLSRVAAVVTMTAIALAARTTYLSETIGAAEKIGIGYLMALAFMGYGFAFRRSRDLFAQAVWGCGLACLYFTTYAAFFIDQTRMLDAPLLAIPALLACLAVLAWVAHWRQSQTVAGVGLFLAYYTVVVSCTQQPASMENLAYALMTCAALAVVALLFHMAHRWMLFSWVALIATHGTYIYFFLERPAGLAMADKTYFWISNGFLSVCFLLFSLACIADARKTGEYRRLVAPLSGVNSAVFLVLTYWSVRDNYPGEQWMFRLVVAGVMLFFAVLAETTGPKRNYLFQIFIAKTVIMLTLALQSYLGSSGEKLMVAMAIECLALAFSYKRSAVVVFKVLGLLLMIITFVGCLASVKMHGTLTLYGFSVPANWFCAVGVAFVFQVTAWFYEKFVRALRPEFRVTSGQWFLADSFLDLHSATMAVAHAAAGALILLTITIMDRGSDAALPFLLAGEGLLMAALGLLLFTPQIEIASVLLLAAAHVCYYVFLWLRPGTVTNFEQQPHYALFTMLLALFTYGGAYAWERYLKRFRYSELDWEHHVVAALPYLASTFLLCTLLGRTLQPVHLASAQGALGMGLLLVGLLVRYPGVKASGVLALALAGLSFYGGLYDTSAAIIHSPDYLWYSSLFLCTFVGSERLFALLQRQERAPSKVENRLRSILVVSTVLLGLMGLYTWCERDIIAFYLLGFAVVMISFGAVFRESRYRWGALALFAIVLIQVFTHFKNLSQPYQVLTFGVSAVVLLVVSWAYSHGRQTAAKKRLEDPPEETPHE